MRAAESVPFTMVEGCGAESPKKFARFLDMSIKSLSEIEEQLELGKDFGIVTLTAWRTHTEEVRVIRKMTWNLRQRVLDADQSTSGSHGKNRRTHNRTPNTQRNR
jgi:four helix bundle protein